MNLLKNILIVGVIALSSFAVNASLITTDWLEVGDNGAVTDNNTEVTWLQLNHTTVSIQSVLNRMIVGGSLEGWSFANRSQMDGLFQNYDTTYIYNSFNKVNGRRYVAGRWYNEITDSSAFMGINKGASWYYDKEGYLGANQYGWWVVKGSGAELSDSSNIYSLPNNYVNSTSSIPVPAPATLVLFLISIAGLLFGRKLKS
jgi:hypothetical protein